MGLISLLQKLVLLIVLLFPVLAIAIDDAGIYFPALILIVFFILYITRSVQISFSREEKLLFYNSILILIAGLYSVLQQAPLSEQIVDQNFYLQIVAYLNFIVFIPLYYVLGFAFKSNRLFIPAAIAGLILAGAFAVMGFDYGFESELQTIAALNMNEEGFFSYAIPYAAFFIFLYLSFELFRRLSRFGHEKVKKYAAAGIMFVVAFTVYFLYSLYQQQAVNVTLPVFYLAMMFALAYCSKDEVSMQGIKRTKKLSVTVIAYNEVDRLGDCLKSVSGWADEIIVFDNGSTDGTIELAKTYTDNVFVTDWPGFGKQKQRALEKAQYDWVLSIDADERVTPALKVEIDRMLSSDPKEIAYRIPWAVTIYNKRLDFGRSGRAPLRLFRKAGARFSDASVHEKVLLPEGKVGLLQERLLHYTHRNLNHAVRKFNDYAWLWGTERFEKGKRVTFIAPIFHGLWTFFVIYFLRLGMLDGFRGLVMAVHLSLYTFNKYTVLWTLEKQAKTS